LLKAILCDAHSSKDVGGGKFIVPSDRSGKSSDSAVVSAMAGALGQLAESIALAAKALPPQVGLSSLTKMNVTLATPPSPNRG
jgi:hypothetical protein